MYGFQISTLSDRQADKGLMFGAVKVNMNEEDINLTSQDESFHRILDATDNLWRSKHVTLNSTKYIVRQSVIARKIELCKVLRLLEKSGR